MYVVNSNGETIQANEGETIRFLKTETKFEKMRIFSEILKRNFKEKVAFTYAHQPLYTNEMIIFFCKTKFSPASQIVRESLKVEMHLDEPLEKIDVMRSLFSVKEEKKVNWYYLTVGAYIIERNLFDCNPINITYVQPISYTAFMRDFQQKRITEEDLQKNALCMKYAVIGGLDLENPVTLIAHAFERDILNGESEKDHKMYRFSQAWKQQKMNRNGEFSNIASACFVTAQGKRNDCYLNYRDIKNMIVKNYKGSYGIKYKDNIITATLNDGRHITIYLYGTNETPIYLIGGKTTINLPKLKELIAEGVCDDSESEWFVKHVKPFL